MTTPPLTSASPAGLSAESDHWVEHHRDANGQFHNTDGPAIVTAQGSQFWFRHGKLHRLDGPAVCASDGTGEWYVDGEMLPYGDAQMLTALLRTDPDLLNVTLSVYKPGDRIRRLLDAVQVARADT